MANFSDKADEVVGKAKQAAGDLTGNDELRAEGTVDEAKAQVKQGVDAAADKAEDAVHAVADAASTTAAEVRAGVSDTAEQLHLGDKRVLVIAAIAGLALTLLLRNVRGRNNDRRAATKRAAKRATKRAAKTGLGRALTS